VAPTSYALCGTAALSAVFPAPVPWSTPTAASRADVTHVSIKTDFESADSTKMTGTTGTTGTPETTGTETTSGTKKMERTNTLTASVARNTSVAVSSTPGGPGRRQLVGV
jgi:hypothetical protein